MIKWVLRGGTSALALFCGVDSALADCATGQLVAGETCVVGVSGAGLNQPVGLPLAGSTTPVPQIHSLAGVASNLTIEGGAGVVATGMAAILINGPGGISMIINAGGLAQHHSMG